MWRELIGTFLSFQDSFLTPTILTYGRDPNQSPDETDKTDGSNLVGMMLKAKDKQGGGIENNPSMDDDINKYPLELSTISMVVNTKDQVGCNSLLIYMRHCQWFTLG